MGNVVTGGAFPRSQAWGYLQVVTLIAMGAIGCIEDSPRAKPILKDWSAFAFYSTSGTFKVYQGGALEKEEPTHDFFDGALRFILLSQSKAMMIGNQGSTSDIKVYRTPNSISFVEPVFGAEHIFTVYDEWLPEQKGFRATYHRTVMGLSDSVLRSQYSGYARQP